jgi:hypothetical protein
VRGSPTHLENTSLLFVDFTDAWGNFQVRWSPMHPKNINPLFVEFSGASSYFRMRWSPMRPENTYLNYVEFLDASSYFQVRWSPMHPKNINPLFVEFSGASSYFRVRNRTCDFLRSGPAVVLVGMTFRWKMPAIGKEFWSPGKFSGGRKRDSDEGFRRQISDTQGIMALSLS